MSDFQSERRGFESHRPLQVFNYPLATFTKNLYPYTMLTNDDLEKIKGIVTAQVGPLAQIGPLVNDIKDIKSDLKRIDKTLKTAIDVFDRRDIKMDKRVNKIENHLGMSSKN